MPAPSLESTISHLPTRWEDDNFDLFDRFEAGLQLWPQMVLSDELAVGGEDQLSVGGRVALRRNKGGRPQSAARWRICGGTFIHR